MAEPSEPLGLYEYTPLPSPRSIRLLELFAGSKSDPIHCALHCVDFDGALRYEAISYTWGDASCRVNLNCDDKSHSVTTNLRDALQQLRFVERSRLLWADAVCIDQSNLFEKGMQVRLMKSIYNKASKICIWLGLGDVDTPLAIDLIRQLVQEVGVDEDLIKLETPQLATAAFVSRYKSRRDSETILHSDSHAWQAVVVLFSAPWFERMWVIQEANGHDCIIFIGQFNIAWRYMIVAAQWLLELQDNNFFKGRTTSLKVENCVRAIQIHFAGHDGLDIDIFDTFRWFRCSDDRDKVYALMSFPPLSELDPPLTPEYNKSVAEVYEATAARCFITFKSLHWLSAIDHDASFEDGWASWVPRWDHNRNIQILHNYASGKRHGSLARVKYTPGTLTAEGICVTFISKLSGIVTGSILAPSIDDNAPVVELFQYLLSDILPRLTEDDMDSCLDYLAMTLTVGLDAKSTCPPADMAQFRYDFLSFVQKFMEMTSFQHKSDMPSIFHEGAAQGNTQSFEQAAQRGSKNKRFFWTPTGEIGLGPKAAQAGDIIILLYGAQAPCVLRPQGAYYRYVGECYLHEQMHGEPIDKVREGILVAEEFVLK